MRLSIVAARKLECENATDKRRLPVLLSTDWIRDEQLLCVAAAICLMEIL